MTVSFGDLAGLSAPATKLIEVVSAGLGVVWRPVATRLEAKAKAYEIETISDAQGKAEKARSDLQLSTAMSRLDTLGQFNPDLAYRARQRLLLREVEGQANLEAIVDHAYQQLPPHVSDVPVDPAWRRKFFQEAESVCDEDMHHLWGRLLAGEVSSPNSYSVRTLSVLAQLSRDEAKLFQLACVFVFNTGFIPLLPSGPSESLAPYGLNFFNILRLRDAGLLDPGDNLAHTFGPVHSGESGRFALTGCNGIPIELTFSHLSQLRVECLLLTTAGRELSRLVSSEPNDAYLRQVGDYWRSKGIIAKKGPRRPPGVESFEFSIDEDL